MAIHRGVGPGRVPEVGVRDGGPQFLALAALERLAVNRNRATASLAMGPILAVAAGGGPQAGEAMAILGRLTASPNREAAEAATRALEGFVAGGGPVADLAQEVLILQGRRLSGLSLEDELEALRRVQAGLRPGPVDVSVILRPPGGVCGANQAYVPHEDVMDPPVWERYRQKLDGIITALPAKLFGSEEPEQAENRGVMRRALALGGQGGAYPDSWFNKTMATAEARLPAGQRAIRTGVATAINCLYALQQRGCQRDVFNILHGLLFYADACPDRSSFGINYLDIMTRLFSQIAGEQDGDRQAMLLLEELVQQSKFNFVRTELTAGYGNAGEALEGYLFQCLRLKDVLGFRITMERMLYSGLGRGFAGGDFEADLRRVLERLNSEDDFLAFVTTPPVDSQLSSIPQWEQVAMAPIGALVSCTSEADRCRLLVSIVRPMLQALGVVRGPALLALQDRARAGDLESIKIIYWQGMAGQEGALAFLRELPCTVRDLDCLGLLAKVGNGAAQRILAERCDLLQRELESITDPIAPRREELIGEVTKIGRYGLEAAVRVLKVARAASELWSLASIGNRPARVAFGELVNIRDPDAALLLRAASEQGDPLAAEITASLRRGGP